MTQHMARTYTERLWPSPWLIFALLLVIPAVTLTLYPINQVIAAPVGVVVFAAIVLTLVLASPTITLENGTLKAGHAHIPVSKLGEVVTLTRTELSSTIGPRADARAYLVIRGYIHHAVKIEINDEADPTPYWIITTRRPEELRDALVAAKSAAV